MGTARHVFVRGEHWRFHRAIRLGPRSPPTRSLDNGGGVRAPGPSRLSANRFYLWTASCLRTPQRLLDEPPPHALPASEAEERKTECPPERTTTIPAERCVAPGIGHGGRIL